MISAGPTYEPIDPVRFLGNRSSGKMGYALAEAALRRGARVTLVSGPTALAAPAVEEFVPVESSAQMREALLARFGRASITIMTAAVSDFAPAEVAGQKIKREGALNLELQPTADILAELGCEPRSGTVAGGICRRDPEPGGERPRENWNANIWMRSCSTMFRAPAWALARSATPVRSSPPSEATVIAEMSKLEMAGRILDAVVKLRARQQTPKVTA